MRYGLLLLLLAGCEPLAAGAQGFSSHPLGPNPGGSSGYGCVSNDGCGRCRVCLKQSALDTGGHCAVVSGCY